jgi:hypothetical protein
MTVKLKTAYALELASYRQARVHDDQMRAWHHLERAHILGQVRIGLHIDSHLRMLGYAVHLRQPQEVLGQIFRLVLAPLGNLTGRLPIGNTGRADVNAFAPMVIPEDLKVVLENDVN